MRRWLIAVALAAPFWASAARASTWTDAAALLLDESRRSAEWVQSHATDRALAGIAQRLAEERVKSARRLVVPKEADAAHPHLLLALEMTERAFAAAEQGDFTRFLRVLTQSRDEERTLRAVLDQAKLKLPELDKKRD